MTGTTPENTTDPTLNTNRDLHAIIELSGHSRHRDATTRGGLMVTWRDVDSERPNWGVTLWRTGGEVRLGRRLYRWRYGR